MSIKGFLQAKEMQTGGMLQSFTGPFANQEKRNPSGPAYIPPSYEPPKPRTITLPPITPPPPAAPTAEEIAKLDPGTVGSHADYNYNVTDAIAGAAKAGMGPLTPAQIGMLEPEFAASLAATVQPETDLSRGFDKFALGVVAPVVAATLGTVFPPLGIAGAVMSKAGVIGSKDGIINTIFGGREPTATVLGSGYSQNPAAPTVSESVSLNAAIPTSSTSIAPIASEFGPMGGGYLTPGSAGSPLTSKGMDQGFASTVTSAVPAATAIGSEMFGNIYGMGGEISPNFAIGGKGSFTSFAHYGAGISQADEINIVSNAASLPGLFSSASEGKDTIDTMVSNGYNEAQITAVSKGELDEGELDSLAQAVGMEDAGVSGGGDADSVICQELYDQGLLEHSIYSLDEQFGEQLRKHDSDLLEGYHTWAYDVVNAMRKSKTITHIVRIVSRPVIKHIAYKMGYPSKTLLGAVMFNVGAFVCRRLAKKETVYA